MDFEFPLAHHMQVFDPLNRFSRRSVGSIDDDEDDEDRASPKSGGGYGSHRLRLFTCKIILNMSVQLDMSVQLAIEYRIHHDLKCSPNAFW
jgi:hypothetical protein